MATLRKEIRDEGEKMYELGRICVKTAGRDARLKCVIIDVLEGNFVMIDGQTRRKRCNIAHLEPLDKVLKVKKNASHDDVAEILKKEGIEVAEKVVKEKKTVVKKAVKSKKTVAKAEEKDEKPKKTVKKTAKKDN
jgi:large subunit ribosomal protein L14e